jgi:hypothetical protein
MMTSATTLRAIGGDNGIGDAFYADIKHADGNTERVVVYGGNIQGATRLLRLFADIENFTIINTF